jgi:digeranylgeranylglycerophospholipid reductase
VTGPKPTFVAFICVSSCSVFTMEFDVVIIGASTSGLHAAQKLASAGRRVAVFDRQKELKPARRTLIVTPALRKLLGRLPTEILLHRTGTIVVNSLRCTTSVKLKDPDWIVERAALTRWLLSKAQAAGVQLFLGYRFVGFEENGGDARCLSTVGVRFRNSRNEKIAWARKAIVGADGITSDVAQVAGIPLPSSVPIVQAEVALPPNWDPNVTQVWFDAADSRFFYWLIPESTERGVVGLIGDNGTQTHLRLRAFLNRNNLKVEAFQGAKVALHHPLLKPWGKVKNIPLLMVGDAAGQVKSSTVGGLVTGIQAAEAASRAIIKGTAYRAELRPLKRELDLHWLIRLLVDRLDSRGYDLLVRAVSSRLEQFLSCHNRDNMAPNFWQIPFVEPRLLQVAFRCLRGSPTPVQIQSNSAQPAFTQVTNPES